MVVTNLEEFTNISKENLAKVRLTSLLCCNLGLADCCQVTPTCNYMLSGKVQPVVNNFIPCWKGRTWNFVPGQQLPTVTNTVTCTVGTNPYEGVVAITSFTNSSLGCTKGPGSFHPIRRLQLWPWTGCGPLCRCVATSLIGFGVCFWSFFTWQHGSPPFIRAGLNSTLSIW
jgi:hypothetical protein